MNGKRYIVVLDLFGDQESVNMGRWCRKINRGTLPPSTKVAAVVHEKIIYSSFTLKEYPSISQPLSVIFLSYFTVCSPFPSFKFQGPQLSLVKNREYSYGPWIVARSKTLNLLLQKKKYDIHTAHGRLFHLHPTPPQGFSIPGGSLMIPLPRGISKIVKREFLPPAEIQSGF